MVERYNIVRERKFAYEYHHNYSLDIRSLCDVYAFNMPINDRGNNPQEYRFGFNGMEKDPEWTGQQGSHYTTEFRAYDSRIGRWWSIDPMYISFPWQSPYVAFDNNPVLLNDPKGLAAQNENDDDKKESEGNKGLEFSDNFKAQMQKTAEGKKIAVDYIVSSLNIETKNAGDVSRIKEIVSENIYVKVTLAEVSYTPEGEDPIIIAYEIAEIEISPAFGGGDNNNLDVVIAEKAAKLVYTSPKHVKSIPKVKSVIVKTGTKGVIKGVNITFGLLFKSTQCGTANVFHDISEYEQLTYDVLANLYDLFFPSTDNYPAAPIYNVNVTDVE